MSRSTGESKDSANQLAMVFAVIFAAVIVVLLMMFIITRSTESQEERSIGSVQPLIGEMNQASSVFAKSSDLIDLAYEVGYSESAYTPLLEDSNQLATLISKTYQEFSDFISETIDEDENIVYVLRENATMVPSSDTEKRFRDAISKIREQKEVVMKSQEELTEKTDSFKDMHEEEIPFG